MTDTITLTRAEFEKVLKVIESDNREYSGECALTNEALAILSKHGETK